MLFLTDTQTVQFTFSSDNLQWISPEEQFARLAQVLLPEQDGLLPRDLLRPRARRPPRLQQPAQGTHDLSK